MKAFPVDLKACFSLVLPNQYCFIASEAGFWVTFFLHVSIWSLLCSTIALYDYYSAW